MSESETLVDDAELSEAWESMRPQKRIDAVLAFANEIAKTSGGTSDRVCLIRYDGAPTEECVRIARLPLALVPERIRAWVCKDIRVHLRRAKRGSERSRSIPDSNMAVHEVGGVRFSAVRVGEGGRRWGLCIEETGVILKDRFAATRGQLWARLEMDYKLVAEEGAEAWLDCIVRASLRTGPELDSAPFHP